MSKIHEVKAAFAARAHVDAATYAEMYRRSVEDNEEFWAEQAARIDWIKPFSKVRDVSYATDDLRIRWYYDGTLNVCYNCVDRHLESKGDDVAIIWEGDDPARDLTITYRELHERVCKFANALKKDRRQKGRPNYNLYADDSGGGGINARLRANRCSPLGRVWWFFAGSACRSNS